MIKETLIREYAKRGGNLRRREARGLIKIDVNKVRLPSSLSAPRAAPELTSAHRAAQTAKIWDLLVEMGVLSLTPPPPSTVHLLPDDAASADLADVVFPTSSSLDGLALPQDGDGDVPMLVEPTTPFPSAAPAGFVRPRTDDIVLVKQELPEDGSTNMEGLVEHSG